MLCIMQTQWDSRVQYKYLAEPSANRLSSIIDYNLNYLIITTFYNCKYKLLEIKLFFIYYLHYTRVNKYYEQIYNIMCIPFCSVS